ncbi:hypothetical protein, partial [Olsenella sp. SW781]|uniref:hypothetical protein n=1 Tax=Olsenella sp. SW781 TaxID=2530046 RepID=UPI001981F136
AFFGLKGGFERRHPLLARQIACWHLLRHLIRRENSFPLSARLQGGTTILRTIRLIAGHAAPGADPDCAERVYGQNVGHASCEFG